MKKLYSLQIVCSCTIEIQAEMKALSLEFVRLFLVVFLIRLRHAPPEAKVDGEVQAEKNQKWLAAVAHRTAFKFPPKKCFAPRRKNK